MRIHQGKFAYELKLVRDRQTQIATGWEFRIFEAKPREKEKLLFIGKTRPTRELAEREAEQVIELLAYNKMAYNRVA
jgi:hypothetical protein